MKIYNACIGFYHVGTCFLTGGFKGWFGYKFLNGTANQVVESFDVVGLFMNIISDEPTKNLRVVVL